MLQPTDIHMGPSYRKEFFTTWPGLSAEAVRKFLPKSLATAKGHLKTSPKNLRSTSKSRPNISTIGAPTVMTTPPSTLEPTVRTHLVYAKVVTITGQIYSDQTGRFPVTSAAKETNTLWSFTTMIPLQSLPNPSKTAPKVNSCAPIPECTSISPIAASNPNFKS
jgi:hypothetical protein